MDPAPVVLACRCGASTFGVRADANQGVALVTCPAGHCSFVLDSRDHWADILQDGRPKALACRCKAKLFAVSVRYQRLAPNGPVSHVSVRGRCVVCDRERAVFDQEIDYEPTDALIERPLDPVDDPWLKARRVQLTGFWLPDDLDRFVRFVGGLDDARLFFAGRQQAPSAVSADEMVAAFRAAEIYTLLFTNQAVSWPANLRDVWRGLPVVEVSSPFRIQYPSGAAELTYVTYAIEDVVDGRIEPRDAAFVAFTTRMQAWLRASFVGGRGAHAVDNPDEKTRLGF